MNNSPTNNVIEKRFLLPLDEVQAFLIDGEPYFCLAHICSVLNVRFDKVYDHRFDKDGVREIQVTECGARKITVINDVNVYLLCGSRDHPRSKYLQRWITHEAIPQLKQAAQPTVVGRKVCDPEQLLRDVHNMISGALRPPRVA